MTHLPKANTDISDVDATKIRVIPALAKPPRNAVLRTGNHHRIASAKYSESVADVVRRMCTPEVTS